MFAGLVPRLRAAGGWLISRFRPDDDPQRGLLRALARDARAGGGAPPRRAQSRGAWRACEQGRRRSPSVVAGMLAPAPGQRTLIIADQFEQIYTLVADVERRERFIADLICWGRASSAAPRIVVLLTLRADFLGRR